MQAAEDYINSIEDERDADMESRMWAEIELKDEMIQEEYLNDISWYGRGDYYLNLGL